MPPTPLVIHHASHSPERPLLEADLDRLSSPHATAFRPFAHSPVPQSPSNPSASPSIPIPNVLSFGTSTRSNISYIADALRTSPPPPLTSTSTYSASSTLATPMPTPAPAGPSRLGLNVSVAVATPSPISPGSSLSPPSTASGLVRVKSFPHSADLLGDASRHSSRPASLSASPVAPNSDLALEPMDLDEDGDGDEDAAEDALSMTVVPSLPTPPSTLLRPILPPAQRLDDFQTRMPASRLRNLRERMSQARQEAIDRQASLERVSESSFTTSTRQAPSTFVMHSRASDPAGASGALLATWVQPDVVDEPSDMRRAWAAMEDVRDGDLETSSFRNMLGTGESARGHREHSAPMPEGQRELARWATASSPVLASRPNPLFEGLRRVEEQQAGFSSSNGPHRAAPDRPILPPGGPIRQPSGPVPIVLPASPIRQERRPPAQAAPVPIGTGVVRSLATRPERNWPAFTLPGEHPQSYPSPARSDVSSNFAASSARARARARESIPISYARNPDPQGQQVGNGPLRLPQEEHIIPRNVFSEFGLTGDIEQGSSSRLRFGDLARGSANRSAAPSRTINSEATVPPPRFAPEALMGWETSDRLPAEPLPPIALPRRQEEMPYRERPPTPFAASHISAQATTSPNPMAPSIHPTSPSPIAPGLRSEPSIPIAPALNRSTSIGTAFRSGLHRERLARLDHLRTQGEGDLPRRQWANRPPWLDPQNQIPIDLDPAEPIQYGPGHSSASSLATGELFGFLGQLEGEGSSHDGTSSGSSGSDVSMHIRPAQPPVSGTSGSGQFSTPTRPRQIRWASEDGVQEPIRSWNRTVQEAVGRRMPYDRPPRDIGSRRAGEPSATRNPYTFGEFPDSNGLRLGSPSPSASAYAQPGLSFPGGAASVEGLWGEIPQTAGGIGARRQSDSARLHRLPRAFAEPEQRPESASRGGVGASHQPGGASSGFAYDGRFGAVSGLASQHQPIGSPSRRRFRDDEPSGEIGLNARNLIDMAFLGGQYAPSAVHGDILDLTAGPGLRGHPGMAALPGGFAERNPYGYVGGPLSMRRHHGLGPLEPEDLGLGPDQAEAEALGQGGVGVATAMRERERERERAARYGHWVQTLELKESMSDEEKKVVVQMVVKGVTRLPGSSRRKAADSTLEHVKWGAIGEAGREGMERDGYCSVCHDEYEDDIMVAITPCKHMYHQDCLATWLSTPNTSSCPMCRRDLVVLACLTRMVPSKTREEAMPLWLAAI